jgi:hypothetical protein
MSSTVYDLTTLGRFGLGGARSLKYQAGKYLFFQQPKFTELLVSDSKEWKLYYIPIPRRMPLMVPVGLVYIPQ